METECRRVQHAIPLFQNYTFLTFQWNEEGGGGGSLQNFHYMDIFNFSVVLSRYWFSHQKKWNELIAGGPTMTCVCLVMCLNDQNVTNNKSILTWTFWENSDIELWLHEEDLTSFHSPSLSLHFMPENEYISTHKGRNDSISKQNYNFKLWPF